MNLEKTKVSINWVYSQKQSFWQKFKIIMNLNKPIYQCWSNSLINFLLHTHIGWIWTPFFLDFQHIFVNFLAKFRNMLNIIHCSEVYFLNSTKYLVFTSLIENLKFLMKFNSRKFFSWWSSNLIRLNSRCVFFNLNIWLP